MHELSIIKNAALHALDDDAEDEKEGRIAEFRSIADPMTVFEMAQEIERRTPAEEHAEALQLLRELTAFVEKQSGGEAQELAMRAKVLL